MPKRSNDFQELVDSIHRLFSPTGATITTSAMVASEGGRPREVDILIEFKTDLAIPFKIAVEAKDHTRPIDAIGVERYIGKYNTRGGINVDKVVIVAHSFTPAAKKRAVDLGFSLHTLNEFDGNCNVSVFTPSAGTSGAWWVTPHKPHKGVKVTLLDKKGISVPLTSTITPRTSKEDLGKARDWAERLLNNVAGTIANETYREHAGTVTHVIVEIVLSNRKARHGRKSANLGKMVFDFGRRMQLPPTETKAFALANEDGEVKNIVRETGVGRDGLISIIYEKPQLDGHPKSIYLAHKARDNGALKCNVVRVSVPL